MYKEPTMWKFKCINCGYETVVAADVTPQPVALCGFCDSSPQRARWVRYHQPKPGESRIAQLDREAKERHDKIRKEHAARMEKLQKERDEKLCEAGKRAKQRTIIALSMIAALAILIGFAVVLIFAEAEREMPKPLPASTQSDNQNTTFIGE